MLITIAITNMDTQIFWKSRMSCMGVGWYSQLNYTICVLMHQYSTMLQISKWCSGGYWELWYVDFHRLVSLVNLQFMSHLCHDFMALFVPIMAHTALCHQGHICIYHFWHIQLPFSTEYGIVNLCANNGSFRQHFWYINFVHSVTYRMYPFNQIWHKTL